MTEKFRIPQREVAELFEKLTKVFKNNNSIFWLEFGTLLGKIRENRTIPHDGDVDLVVDFDDWNPNILNDLKKEGINISKKPNKITNNTILTFVGKDKLNTLTQIKFNYKGIRMSFEIYHRGIGKYKDLMFFWPSPKPDWLFQMPRHLMYPQIKTDFYGSKVLIPKNYKENLEFMYGKNWNISNSKYKKSGKWRESSKRFRKYFSKKKYIRNRRPVLDKHNKFMFFGNHKAGLTSVNRNILKGRIINWKNFKSTYFSELEKYSDNEIEKIFKFTIVRNPFSRVVSAFFYLKSLGILGQNKLFQEFIKTDFLKKGVKTNPHFHQQYPSAFHQHVQFIDYIAKLENIKEDWKFIASKINCSDKIPHKNISKHKPYQEYYDKETIKIVEEIYREDLERFGYKFGD